MDMLTAVEVVLWTVFAVFALRGARWAYAIFVILGHVWIPARTHFHLHAPPCDGDLSLAMVRNALMKYKHVTLFGLFFLMTAAQLPKTRSALWWAGLATIVMGVLIELEEGATGTGYCHLADLLPDATGAILGALILLGKRAWEKRLLR